MYLQQIATIQDTLGGPKINANTMSNVIYGIGYKIIQIGTDLFRELTSTLGSFASFLYIFFLLHCWHRIDIKLYSIWRLLWVFWNPICLMKLAPIHTILMYELHRDIVIQTRKVCSTNYVRLCGWDGC